MTHADEEGKLTAARDSSQMADPSAGYARTYIIAPGLIYGLGSGTLYDIGIAKRESIQIPSLIRASIDRKRSGIIGPGKSVWPNVHLDDGASSVDTRPNKNIFRLTRRLRSCRPVRLAI